MPWRKTSTGREVGQGTPRTEESVLACMLDEHLPLEWMGSILESVLIIHPWSLHISKKNVQIKKPHYAQGIAVATVLDEYWWMLPTTSLYQLLYQPQCWFFLLPNSSLRDTTGSIFPFLPIFSLSSLYLHLPPVLLSSSPSLSLSLSLPAGVSVHPEPICSVCRLVKQQSKGRLTPRHWETSHWSASSKHTPKIHAHKHTHIHITKQRTLYDKRLPRWRPHMWELQGDLFVSANMWIWVSELIIWNVKCKGLILH